MVVSPIPFRPISRTEQRQREEIFQYVQNTIGLEGFTLSSAARTLFQRYIRGEITRLELNDEVARLAGTY